MQHLVSGAAHWIVSVRAVRTANFLDELAERERSGGEKSICGPERDRCVNLRLLNLTRRELLITF